MSKPFKDETESERVLTGSELRAILRDRAGFAARGFGLKLPIGRAVDGNSSEGLGIAPDVEAAPGEALSRAMRLLDVRGAPGMR